MASGQLTDIQRSNSVADQTGFDTETLLAGSVFAVPKGRLPVAARATYKLTFDMTKTAAGTATPLLYINYGTAGTAADTAILTFTFGAGTAAVDVGVFEVLVTFRTVGATGVATGVAKLDHSLAATGLTNTGTGGCAVFAVTSSAFSTVVADSYISASFNGGTSFAGTNTLVQAEWENY